MPSITQKEREAEMMTFKIVKDLLILEENEIYELNFKDKTRRFKRIE